MGSTVGPLWQAAGHEVTFAWDFAGHREWQPNSVSALAATVTDALAGRRPSQLSAQLVAKVTDLVGSHLGDPLPASPREKSHSKSQRRPVSGDTQLRQATVEAGQVPSEPSPATSSDVWEVTGGQGGRRFNSGRPDW